MIRTTPLRRMTLQFRHIFLTDAATFIACLFLSTHQVGLNEAFFNSDSYCWLIT